MPNGPLIGYGANTFGDIIVNDEILFDNYEIKENDVTGNLEINNNGVNLVNINGTTFTIETDLVVNGTIGFTGDLDMNDNDILQVTNITGNSGTNIINLDDAVTITGNLSVDTDVLFVNTSTNRVGINNANPSQALEVEENTAMSDGAIKITHNDNTDLSSNAVLIAQSGGSSGGDSFVKLKVGDSTRTWTYGIDNSDSDMIKWDTQAGAGDTVPGDNTLMSLATNGNLSLLSGNLDITGTVNVSTGNDYQINTASVLNSTTLGSSVINSSLTNVGTLSALTVSAEISCDGVDVTTGNDYQINNVSVLSATTLGGSVVNSSLTNVGTLSALTVSAEIQSDGIDITTGNDYQINNVSILNSTTLGNSVINSSLTNVGTLSSLTITGNLIVDTDVLFVNTSTNRVGINNATPSQALEVEENTATADGAIKITHNDNTDLSSNAVLIAQSGGSSGGDSFVKLKVGSSTRTWTYGIDNSDSDTIKWDTQAGAGDTIPGENTLMSLTTGGNLSLLSGNLDVTGTMNVSTGNDYQINTASVLNSTTLGGSVINSSLTNVGTLSALTVSAEIACDGVDVSTGNDYQINNVSVLSSTTLGSSVVNASLTANTGNLTNTGTLTNTGNFLVGTDAFWVNASTFDVGIGIITPATNSNPTLHLNAPDSNGAFTRFTNTTTGTTTGDGLQFGINSSEEVVFQNYEATDMRFYTTNIERVQIKAGGDINLITGNAYQINDIDVLDSTTLGTGIINSSLTNIGTLTALSVAGDIDIRDNDKIILSTDNNNYIVYDGTNVTVFTGGALHTTFTDSGKNLTIEGVVDADNINGTTLKSGVVNSSLTNVGTLTALTVSAEIACDGVDVTTGNDYQINNVSILSSTTLGSSVVNSSLTANTGNLTNTGTLTNTGNLLIGTNAFWVNATTFDVGIGIITPAVNSNPTLHLNAPDSNGAFTRFTNTTTGTTTGDGLQLGINSSEEVVIQNYEATDIRFYTTNIERVQIKAGGDINLITGNSYQINDVDVLDSTTLGTGIINSSLTNVGTLTGLTTSGNINLSNSNATIKIDGTNVLSEDTLGSGIVNSSLTSIGTLIGPQEIFRNKPSSGRDSILTLTWDDSGYDTLAGDGLAIDFNVSNTNNAPGNELGAQISGSKGNNTEADTETDLVFSTNDGTTINDVLTLEGLTGDMDLLTGVLKIASTEVLSGTTLGTGVVNSSLTNVGTLTSLSVSGEISSTNDLLIKTQNSVQSIPDASATEYSFTNSTTDVNSGWTDTGGSSLTFPQTGLWSIVVDVVWDGNANGYRESRIIWGPTQNAQTTEPDVAIEQFHSLSTILNVDTVVTTLRLLLTQNSGGNLDVLAGIRLYRLGDSY